ncbi:glutamate--cysteine ligase regulatory subunit [Lutzomyia longipalpis]|uniref:glutamate--cysteine ligase regulatory subunit n=1 Tax=Lutzomyia longipalpis TaxID=7200 RepID=UPI0024839989|nr:glutamate--cysteine ligase regulatory subunit [Lutzomyia longipalpis]
MPIEGLQQYLHLVVNTGNVLNVNKKAGQKPSEELVDCLKATLATPAIEAAAKGAPSSANVTRSGDDLREKVAEHERASVKIGAKLFLNTNSTENLKNAIDTLLSVLGVEYLDNLILAYHPEGRTTNGTAVNGNSGEDDDTKEGVMDWSGGHSDAIQDLKALWKEMEEYAKSKKICQLGIADLDVNSLKELYNGAEFHPSIAQINISTCCVVPPPLQEFCQQNDIQLLTHSDPEEILSKETLKTDLDVENFAPKWTIRFQVHVKCRGVLAAKGYVIGASRE